MKTRIITLAIVLPIIYFSLTNFIRSGSENKTVVTNSEVSDSFISLENSFSKISNAGNLEVPFSKTIKTAAVNDIQTDSKGTVWIATEAGITSINSDRTTVKNYNISEGTFPFSQAESIIFDNKTLWVGTLFGLCKLDESERFIIAPESESLPSQMIWDMHWDNSTIWIGTQNGVAFMTSRKDFQSLTNESTNGALKNNWCKNILKTKHWFITSHDNGISLWNTSFPASNPEIWKNLTFERLSISRPINDMAFDGRYLWFATSKGVFQLATPAEKFFGDFLSKFIVYGKLNGLASNNIKSIISHKDSIWVGTSEGLGRIKDERVQMIYPSSGQYNKNIRKLYASGDILWIGSEAGVQFINTAMVNRNE